MQTNQFGVKLARLYALQGVGARRRKPAQVFRGQVAALLSLEQAGNIAGRIDSAPDHLHSSQHGEIEAPVLCFAELQIELIGKVPQKG